LKPDRQYAGNNPRIRVIGSIGEFQYIWFSVLKRAQNAEHAVVVYIIF